jgi:hypothetical protein
LTVRTVVDVPPTTLLADLDEALRDLLRAQLRRHGFEGADVVFDTPTKDWAAKLTRPTVDVFLYDLIRSSEPSETGVNTTHGAGGRAIDRPVPLRLECWYAISAWAPEVIDEHRLLSQVIAVLNSYPILDADVLGPRLGLANQRYPVQARVAEQRKERRADFWQSVGGHYKPAVDYKVTLAVESGRAFERGPEVRTASVRTRSLDRPKLIATELHHIGGVVRDAAGEPLKDAWVTVPHLGRLADTDADGRFRLGPVPAGEHPCRVRDADGTTSELTVTVPGPPVDVVLAGGQRARRPA